MNFCSLHSPRSPIHRSPFLHFISVFISPTLGEHNQIALITQVQLGQGVVSLASELGWGMSFLMGHLQLWLLGLIAKSALETCPAVPLSEKTHYSPSPLFCPEANRGTPTLASSQSHLSLKAGKGAVKALGINFPRIQYQLLVFHQVTCVHFSILSHSYSFPGGRCCFAEQTHGTQHCWQSRSSWKCLLSLVELLEWQSAHSSSSSAQTDKITFCLLNNQTHSPEIKQSCTVIWHQAGIVDEPSPTEAVQLSLSYLPGAPRQQAVSLSTPFPY